MPSDSLQPLVGGRSNYVWRVLGKTSCVLKLYGLGSRNPLFSNDPDREVSSLKALAGTGMAPRLLDEGAFEGRRWILYTHVTGDTWRRGAEHVAQLLGRLHDQPYFGTSPKGPNGSQQIGTAAFYILDRCFGAVRQQIQDARPLVSVPKTNFITFIHGDPVPGNIVEHDGTLTLIDWQCPVLGDPAEDLAIFASPAMQLLYRGTPLSDQEEEAFFQAYPDRQVVERFQLLKPWFHWRMAAYCLWKTEQGQQEYLDAMYLELEALRRA
ncbi:aminoglycoside phosphotransferase family protein [Aliisedimentitalea scapharcae]|uniref:Aminoglycoside phosphotransferase family protein n=1 Tax=Aliisedimentitalea scapharcae TaxID=1524259 RepID=A0ABZ2XSM8_9RHOB